MYSTRDSQRQRVYNWEDTYFKYSTPNCPTMDFDAARKLIYGVWSKYGKDYQCPTIVCKPGHARSHFKFWSSRGINEIQFNKRAIPAGIVLHEVSHALNWHLHYKQLSYPQQLMPAPHGGEFMQIYLKLVAEYLGRFDYNEMVRAARVAGIAVSSTPVI